jgi:hypothetical protein
MQREAVHRRAGISLSDNKMQNPGSDAGVFILGRVLISFAGAQ